MSLREKRLYLNFFWSVFSLNAEKCTQEKLRIRTLFTQYVLLKLENLFRLPLHLLQRLHMTGFDKTPTQGSFLLLLSFTI